MGPAERGMTWRINLAVRRSQSMPAPSRLIMFVLSDIADAGTAETPPQHTPSLAQLAAETGQSLATVKRHLAELEADGWVERIRPTDAERVRRARTRYRLHVPSQGSQAAQSSPDDTALSDTEHGSQRAGQNGTRLTVTPNTALSDTEHGSQRAIHKEDTHTSNTPKNSSSSAHADEAPSNPEPAKRKPNPLARFPDFWKTYPRRVSKGHAEKAWTKAISSGVDPQVIIDGALVYAFACKTRELQFVKHPATWLNGKCWEDDEATPAAPAPREVETCQTHRLPLPCRGCRADAIADPDDAWATPLDDPTYEPPF